MPSESTKLWIVFLSALTVGACHASSSQQYTPPAAESVANSTQIAAPFDTTWDHLIKNLSKEFFVINNVEKASRIINVSFSTDRPGEFIKCGSRTREYVSGAGKKETVTYDPAERSTFKF